MSDSKYIKIRRFKGTELVSERKTDFFPPQPTWPLVMKKSHARYNGARRFGIKVFKLAFAIAFGCVAILAYLYVSAFLSNAIELGADSVRAAGAWACRFVPGA